MAVIEYDEYKQKLLALEPMLGELEKALGIPKAREEYEVLQKETEQEGFWNNLERSQTVSRQLKRLENKINIPFHIAENPLYCVAKGTALALNDLNYPFLMR